MNRFVKSCAALLAASAVLASAGCSARQPVTADDFQKQAKSAGYAVSASSGSGAGAEKELTATKGGTDVQASFLTFSGASSALSWYNEQKSALSGSVKTVVDSDVYNKCEMTNGEIYCLIVRMDKTAVLCKTTTAKKGEAEALVSSIKY